MELFISLLLFVVSVFVCNVLGLSPTLSKVGFLAHITRSQALQTDLVKLILYLFKIAVEVIQEVAGMLTC